MTTIPPTRVRARLRQIQQREDRLQHDHANALHDAREAWDGITAARQERAALEVVGTQYPEPVQLEDK